MQVYRANGQESKTDREWIEHFQRELDEMRRQHEQSNWWNIAGWLVIAAGWLLMEACKR